MTARSAANMLDINPNSAALFYTKIRQVIVHYLEQDSIKQFAGIIEVDESYFCGVRKGKKGRGASGKVSVFGLLNRGGKVYTKVVCNTKAKTLMPVMIRKIAPDSIVYTDSYRSYNTLDTCDFYHHRINHSKTFGNGVNDINGIEN